MKHWGSHCFKICPQTDVFIKLSYYMLVSASKSLKCRLCPRSKCPASAHVMEFLTGSLTVTFNPLVTLSVNVTWSPLLCAHLHSLYGNDSTPHTSQYAWRPTWTTACEFLTDKDSVFCPSVSQPFPEYWGHTAGVSQRPVQLLKDHEAICITSNGPEA